MFRPKIVRLLPALALGFFVSVGTIRSGASAAELSAAEPKGSPGSTVFNVQTFGAKGDGRSLDTEAIQKALDTCAKAGGGIVLFPRGTYLSKPLTLGNRTTMQL